MENEKFVMVAFSEYLDEQGRLVQIKVYQPTEPEPPIRDVIDSIELVEDERPARSVKYRTRLNCFNRKKHYEYDE